jgi:hypothetical protein
MMRQLTLVLVIGGTVALATGACTTTSGNNGQHDGGGSDVIHQFDGSTPDGGGNDGGGGACTQTGFTAVSEAAGFDSSYNETYYDGYSSADSPYNWLSVGLYFDYGNPKPTLGPGTYTLGGTTEEQSLATCGTCVVLYTGCDDTARTCDKTYFAMSGTLTVTAMDNVGGFVGSLANARLVEVTVNSSTGATTPVANGSTWCLPSYTFDQPLEYPLPCASNTECASFTDTPYCDTASSECVQCLQESHCASLTDTPHCETTYFYCVQCLQESHCAALTATPHCDTDYNECAECVEDAHCAANANGHFCVGGQCGACNSSFGCTNAAAPVCQYDQTSGRAVCGAGGTCTADDAGEPGDDGPAGARTLAPTVATTGAVCDADLEQDYYKIVTAATGAINVSLTWTATGADLDLYVYDSTGLEIGYSESTTGTSESVALTAKPAGTYYAKVVAYSMGTATDAIPYSITFAP